MTPFARARATAERVAQAADDIGASARVTGDTMRLASGTLAAVALVALVALALSLYAVTVATR